jgi:streptogramin lyase
MPPTRRTPSARLRVERLEDRAVPAVLTEFPVPTAASSPTDIVRAADGNFWFTEFGADRVGRITPAGVVTEFVLPAGRGPLGIAAGPDGLIYFAERTGDRIGRLDPLAGSDAAIQASLAEFVVPGVGSAPTDITAGPDGNLWFTQTASNEIGRLTPAGVVTEFAVPGANSAPTGITSGPDGALWFTQSVSNEIGRIATDGTVTEFAVPGDASAPNSIATGPDGALWFTQFGSDQIGRITTAGVVTDEFPLHNGAAPQGIVAGADGRLYFAESGRDRIGRIFTSGLATELALGMTAGSTPTALAFAPGGTLFFTEQAGNRIGRLTDALFTAPLFAAAVGTTVTAFDVGGVVRFVLTPYAGFVGTVSVAVGDVDGDGFADVVTGTATGASHVKAFSGRDGTEIRSFLAFPGFLGGVNVAAGDVNGDGAADIVVGAGPGTPGGHVKVFDGRTGAELASFFGYVGFIGGVSVAAGDVDGDGLAEIVTGTANGSSHVKVFDLAGAELQSYFAFPGFLGGANVAAGDVDGDGFDDVIVGAGPGAGAHVKAFDGQTQAELASFFAYAGFDGGVFVGGIDLDGDGMAGVITGAGSVAPHVKIFVGLPLTEVVSFIVPGLGNVGARVAGLTGSFEPGTPVIVPVQPTIDLPPTPVTVPSLENLYVFRSPTNANNTVITLTAGAFAGNVTRALFDSGRVYALNVDVTGDAEPDTRLLVKFSGPAETNGVQDYVVQSISATGLGVAVVARGRTGTTAPTGLDVPVSGGGTVRAGVQDDPFFFDKGGFDAFVDDGVGTFPRPAPANPASPQPNEARNFYGPNGNVLAVTVELPSARIAPNNALVGVWGTLELANDGPQVDRVGRPLIDTLLIPPVPRNDPTPGERRDDFAQGDPADDRANFKADVAGVLTDFYGRTLADANAIADLLLPDMLVYQIGNPNGFGTFVTSGTGQGGFFAGTVLGNGRRLRDDVFDTEINIFTNGAITTDNVPDDNGTRITDGNMGTTAAFPYIGPANLPLNGPGTGPNP